MATKYSKMLSHGNRVMRHVTSSRRQASDDVTKSHGMQRRLEGKVAVITGSTGGIGFATAERLASEGAKVMICSRTDTAVTEAVNKLRAQGFTAHGTTCHVGRPDEIIALMEKTADIYGQLDIAVANAASAISMTPMLETWQVNVKGTFITVREAAKQMKKTERPGSIVMMSSAATYWTLPRMGAYTSTKAAMLNMMKNLAPELHEMNIRVNCIAPGLFPTKLGDGVMNDEDTFGRITNGDITMARLGKVEEVAAAVAFLASDDASYITGETMVVAGGVTGRL